MSVEIQNKMKFNGTEYSIGTDTIQENSSQLATSGAVFEALRSLSAFMGKTLTDVVSQGNNGVMTSGAVYTFLSGLYSFTANMLVGLMKHNILYPLTSYGTQNDPYVNCRDVGKTYIVLNSFSNGARYRYSSDSTPVKVDLQKGIVYYVYQTDGTLTPYMFSGTTFEPVTINQLNTNTSE